MSLRAVITVSTVLGVATALQVAMAQTVAPAAQVQMAAISMAELMTVTLTHITSLPMAVLAGLEEQAATEELVEQVAGEVMAATESHVTVSLEREEMLAEGAME